MRGGQRALIAATPGDESRIYAGTDPAPDSPHPVSPRNARSLALLDAYGRLARLFDGLAIARADGTRLIAQRLTQKDIAQRIGCSRELVTRLLRDLQQGGYVALEAQRYTLLRKLPAKW